MVINSSGSGHSVSLNFDLCESKAVNTIFYMLCSKARISRCRIANF